MALMLMLVALGIVSTICVGLLKMALAERHQARREVVAAQARWLAESGIDIAAALLKRDEDASGMTWTVSAAQLRGSHSATVTVTIARIDGMPRRRQLTVVAEYPATNPQPIRRQIVRFIEL
jgi:type II secretory pathway component PulK